MRVEGLDALVGTIKGFIDQGKQAEKASVIVGFSQRYAIYVHENPDAQHPVGQYKFLEVPARQLSNDGTLGKIIAKKYIETGNMEEALLTAGFRLQRAAQQMVPVDTSALKASSYTCPERRHEAEATSAFAQSEAIRVAEVNRRNKEKGK